MGQVWSAQDTVLDRRVAVKVLLPRYAGDPGFAARFRAEARAMAALSHPGIVEIYDYGQADGLAYLVMQFVDGESLVSLMRRTGTVDPVDAMRLVIQAAEAVEAAHQQGIIHRDIKPANLLLRKDGRLALTDFGIARIVAADRLTGTDQIVGTASYLAPEQVTGDQIGPSTDVYALGVVAYELMTGGRPFTADTPYGVALKHVHEPPPPLPDSIPEPIREVVLRAMAKDPAERWPTAEALAQAAATAIREEKATHVIRAVSDLLPVRERTAIDVVPEDSPEMTGETTRTTQRPAREQDDSRGQVRTRPGPAPVGRRRLLLAGGGALLVSAIVLIGVLSSNGPGTQQPQGSGTPPSAAVAVPPASSSSSSSSSSASASASPDQNAATRTATPTGASGAPAGTAGPANPTPTNPATQPSPASGTVKLPNLYGMSEEEATDMVRQMNLVADITYETNTNRCFVIDQWPEAGTVVAAGSTVDLTVATTTGICNPI
jgi:eukaryotic-like serine/threonine-protein kinase